MWAAQRTRALVAFAAVGLALTCAWASQSCPEPQAASSASLLQRQSTLGSSSRQLAEGESIDEHPFNAACLGHGASADAQACLSSSPVGPSGGAWQSSSKCQTLAMRVPRPLGCAQRACWLQQLRIAVDGGNAAAGGVRAGVYGADGKLLAVSAVAKAAGGKDHWMELPLSGELHAKEEGDLWLAVQFEERAKIVYDQVEEDADAARVADEDWATGFAVSRNWGAESGRRQWSGVLRAARVQLFIGDITRLPGTLPIIIEAPHGGRIEQGWPQRASGSLLPDANTDHFAEMLRTEFTQRCGGRAPSAVILRVARQGADANRAVGNGTVTLDGSPCSKESSGHCCCDVPDPSDQQEAKNLVIAYHAAVHAAVADATPGSLIVSIHGTARERVEVGVRLSRSRLNAAAARQPPSLSASDWAASTFRPLGPPEKQAELTFGATSMGARLAETIPDMEVIPSPTVLCPDPNTCPKSTSASFFAGGHVLKISTSDTTPGVQLEFPPSMRNRGEARPKAAAVRQTAAGLVKFLNEHFAKLGGHCEADVNFGVDCNGHGEPKNGGCDCNTGYDGEVCEQCAEGYVKQDSGECSSVGALGVPEEDLDSEKHAWAYSKSSSGKRYLYWRLASLPALSCGAQGCPPLELAAKIYCDSSSCYSSVSSSSYQMGAAVYSEAGTKLCEALSEVQSPRAEKDWWLRTPLTCPSLQQLSQQSQHVYLAIWFTKKLRLRWENERPVAERAHACTYDEAKYAGDSSQQSSDGCVDAVPPAALPSWRDDACEDLSTYKCKSWTSSGVRNYYGPMVQLIYSKS